MEYSEDEKNLLRKHFLCSIENNFYSGSEDKKQINTEKEFNLMSQNISCYKLLSENILIKKKLESLEKEINELKKIIKN